MVSFIALDGLLTSLSLCWAEQAGASSCRFHSFSAFLYKFYFTLIEDGYSY